MFVRIDDFLLITANLFSRAAHSTAGRALSCPLTGRSKGLTARCRYYQAAAACATKVVVANPIVIQSERSED